MLCILAGAPWTTQASRDHEGHSLDSSVGAMGVLKNIERLRAVLGAPWLVLGVPLGAPRASGIIDRDQGELRWAGSNDRESSEG